MSVPAQQPQVDAQTRRALEEEKACIDRRTEQKKSLLQQSRVQEAQQKQAKLEAKLNDQTNRKLEKISAPASENPVPAGIDPNLYRRYKETKLQRKLAKKKSKIDYKTEKRISKDNYKQDKKAEKLKLKAELRAARHEEKRARILRKMAKWDSECPAVNPHAGTSSTPAGV